MPSLSIWSVQHFKNTLDLGLEPFHPSKDLRPRAEELETTCTILNLEKIQLEFFYFSIFPAILVSFSVSCWYILLRSRKPSWTDGWLDLVIIPTPDIHVLQIPRPHLLSTVTIEASRFPCGVLLVLSWNTTTVENPNTDKLSRAIRAINYSQSSQRCYPGSSLICCGTCSNHNT